MSAYIDLTTVKVPCKEGNYARQIRAVVERLGEQEFNTLQVYTIIMEFPEYKTLSTSSTLREHIKDYLRKAVQRGEIKVVDKSRRWTNGYIYQKVSNHESQSNAAGSN